MVRTIIVALLWGLMLLGLMYGAIWTVDTHPAYKDRVYPGIEVQRRSI